MPAWPTIHLLLVNAKVALVKLFGVNFILLLKFGLKFSENLLQKVFYDIDL